MNNKDIIALRLLQQQIAEGRFADPAQLVHHLGAMQSQEYAMAKWAIGLRISASTNNQVEQLFNEGKILRTHVLRPTWHFISPENIRWMLTLTAPRVNAFNAYMYKKMELNASSFRRCHSILSKALTGKNFLNRTAIAKLLERNKLAANGVRLACLLMEAELAGLICSGPRQGKQFTYALLEERVLPSRKRSYEASLAELATIYFSTRGPATVHDFAWWSGLSVQQAREAVELTVSKWSREKVNEKEYIFSTDTKIDLFQFSHLKRTKQQISFLLPDYDEYGISYKDRSVIFTPEMMAAGKALKENERAHMFVLNGIITGSWKPLVKKGQIEVALRPYRTLNKRETSSMSAAVEKYKNFYAGDTEASMNKQ